MLIPFSPLKLRHVSWGMACRNSQPLEGTFCSCNRKLCRPLRQLSGPSAEAIGSPPPTPTADGKAWQHWYAGKTSENEGLKQYDVQM